MMDVYDKMLYVSAKYDVNEEYCTYQTLYKEISPLNYHSMVPIDITIGSYTIAFGFFSVHGMAVDTLNLFLGRL